MAETISNLKGYKWVGNATMDIPSVLKISHKINFIFNNTIGSEILFMYGNIYYNGNEVYNNSSGWLNENYRTIDITGGTGVTNVGLINIFESFGTLTKSSLQVLEKPSNVSINTNTYDSWILLLENNNSVAVTCYYTILSTTYKDTIEASNQGRIGRNWTSSQTSAEVTMYFSANGYVDSDSITYTLIRPSYLSMNKYRSSNDFTPTMPTDEFAQTLAFTSNNTSFSGMRATTDTLYYVKSDGSEVEVYNTSTKWTGNTEYIAILVSEEQIVAGIFKTFFDTLYKTIDNFEYTLKIKGHETYAIKLNLGGTTYEIK